MGQNLIEKITQKFVVDLPEEVLVKSGDFLTISPAYVMTHDNTGAIMKKFQAIGAAQMANARQPVFTLDHNIQDKSEANIKKYQSIENFAKKMGVDFYPAGRGIGHQIMCEEGYVWPGTMVVASDSHSNMYGGLGCLGSPIVRTDAAALWATGKTWWQIPPVVKVELSGTLQSGVTGKDVILTLCGVFNHDEVLNHAIEFVGSGISYLNIEQRLTIANMTTEWGALAGIFPIDDIVLAWLDSRCQSIMKRGLAGVPSDLDGKGVHPRLNQYRLTSLKNEILRADEDAYYAKHLKLDLSTVTPHVSGPGHVKLMHSVNDIDLTIHKAYLVSCVNSRVGDLAEAAEVVKGKKVAKHVKFYIAAASNEVQAESEKRGDWQRLLDAGAIALPPGCGPCIGLGEGLLEDGEVGISATNRNFKGRMGSPNAEAYLASPAVVAASAIQGKISSSVEFSDVVPKTEINLIPKRSQQQSEIALLEGFPETLEGEILFCHQDNLNTDGIYPGKYTYIDDFSPAQQAQVVMENYDPEFATMAKAGDIVVGGYNFGTGSSREQAATALKYKGIALVLAASFSETYKRNAFNNGFLAIEAPELVNDLKKQYGTRQLTVATKESVQIDFRRSTLVFQKKSYSISSVGTAAQELILAGGLEKWAKSSILDS